MKKLLARFSFLGLFIISSITLLNSCVNNDDLSITEPTRYTAQDIQSYSDLFDVFWTVMDQRYNYFYEQKRRDGMDWSAIYREYSPKFKALKTFGRATENQEIISEDYTKARQYFEEIIDPIIDKHFGVSISMPETNSGTNVTTTFSGGMTNTVYPNSFFFNIKNDYMKDRISSDSFTSSNLLIRGYLNSNPDIYYFAFNSFELTREFYIEFDDKYLSPDKGNRSILTPEIIDKNTALNAISNPETRKKVRDFTVNILNQWNEYPKSEEVASFNREVTKFKNTEVVTDELLELSETLIKKSNELIDYRSMSTYSSVLTPETQQYIYFFIGLMNTHVIQGYRLEHFLTASQNFLIKAPFYKQFLNPLHKGEIKKLILDLRGNIGGHVVDARFFSDRFITKNEIFGYQRTKEGNGRFNYTPWVEAKTKLHKFGIPANIPITILTDNSSASMSELTTLMLKSQGNHVISIGDYSSGATAGLGESDDFNGGIRDVVAGRLTFTMPVMAFKDAKGEVIEGIGIKPDIYVAPLTDEEFDQMFQSIDTFVDRVLNEAIKYLSSK